MADLVTDGVPVTGGNINDVSAPDVRTASSDKTDTGVENASVSRTTEQKAERKSIPEEDPVGSSSGDAFLSVKENDLNGNRDKSQDNQDPSDEHGKKLEEIPMQNATDYQDQMLSDRATERNEHPGQENKKDHHVNGEKPIPGRFDEQDPDTGSAEIDKANISNSQSVMLSLTPRKALIGAIPSNDVNYTPRDSVIGSRTRFPPKLMRMATVSVMNGSRPVTRETSLYVENARLPRKYVSWSEATNSRPPLRIDLEGPTPCTYSPRNKPLRETNAPSYSFGIKCQPEKSGGGRTSWWKTWFQTPHVWLNKVDFLRDRTWPTPSLYENNSPIGTRQAAMPTAPAFTISTKKSSTVKFPGVTEGPSPNNYSRELADGLVLKRSSSFTHGLRRGGTIPWPASDLNPGPGHYEATSACYPACPSFSIQGVRREKSNVLGPFSTF